jgi:hypothetical protein
VTAGLTTVRAAYREPDLATPSSVDELLARSGQVALEQSGAGQSAWNGSVIATDGGILGLAHWDGTLYLDRECILDPLTQMYEHAGEQQPTPTLIYYRESLATLLHEHAHFLGPAGASQDAAREAFIQPGSRQLEEGVAEAWAQDNLNEYLARLGIDKVAPGINTVQTVGHYAAFVPAVRRLATDLETRNDLEPGQVLDALNRETAAGQLPLLVSLVYNSTQLPELEPSGADTRRRLESLVREGLDHLDAFELHPPGFAAAHSHSTAGELLQHLRQEVHTAESAYESPHVSACALPPPTPVVPTPVQTQARCDPNPLRTALSGVSPPRPQPPLASTTAARASGGTPVAQVRRGAASSPQRA